MLITDKKRFYEFCNEKRHWQGIPSIAVTNKGKIFVAFYGGGLTEELGNFCMLKVGVDEQSWEICAVAYSGQKKRCFDPCLWVDPYQRLWFIWAEMPSFEVFAAVCEKPDEDSLVFSEPRVIGYGVMMNKPVVLNSGRWLFPIAVWREGVFLWKEYLLLLRINILSYMHRMTKERVFIS